MKPEDLKQLQPGDIVRGKSSEISYVVTANYGTRVTAVRTQDITNAEEWEIVQKAAPPKSDMVLLNMIAMMSPRCPDCNASGMMPHAIWCRNAR